MARESAITKVQHQALPVLDLTGQRVTIWVTNPFQSVVCDFGPPPKSGECISADVASITCPCRSRFFCSPSPPDVLWTTKARKISPKTRVTGFTTRQSVKNLV